MVFKDRAAAVCLQKPHQVIDLSLYLPSGVRLSNLHAVLQVFKDRGGGSDVKIFPYCLLFAGKGVMGDNAVTVGVENESISRDAAGFLISLAEPAVDDHQLTAALDRTLALSNLDRDMAVDDMAVGAFQTKLFQDRVWLMFILLAPSLKSATSYPGQSTRFCQRYQLSDPRQRHGG